MSKQEQNDSHERREKVWSFSFLAELKKALL